MSERFEMWESEGPTEYQNYKLDPKKGRPSSVSSTSRLLRGTYASKGK